MKLRVRALTAVAAAAAIVGLTPVAASAAAHPGAGAHRSPVATSAAAHPGPGVHRSRVADGPTAQLVFDDYLATVNSIYIIDNNTVVCFTTPLTVNVIPNWYWDNNTFVWPFTSNNCTTGRLGGEPLNLTDSPTSPPYHCLEDVSPFLDWNPGEAWQNCRVPGKTPFYGYAVGQQVQP